MRVPRLIGLQVLMLTAALASAGCGQGKSPELASDALTATQESGGAASNGEGERSQNENNFPVYHGAHIERPTA